MLFVCQTRLGSLGVLSEMDVGQTVYMWNRLRQKSLNNVETKKFLFKTQVVHDTATRILLDQWISIFFLH